MTDPFGVVFRLAWRRVARGAVLWGALFALTAVSSVYAYESTYGTAAERAVLVRGLAGNAGMRALFGEARAIDTVDGFLAWRLLGILPLIAGAWGLLAATRLLRGEEESGRWATILAAPITRARATAASLAAIGVAAFVLFALTALALLAYAAAGTLPVAGSLWLAFTCCVAAVVFAAVGAVTSQIAPSRREAAALAAAIYGLAFVLRVAADASSSAGWLRWLTPFGWIEEVHAMTGERPVALLPLIVFTAAVTLLALAVAARRDEGASLLRRGDTRAPRRGLLTSPFAFGLRQSVGGFVAWAIGLAASAAMFGALADAVADLARESDSIQQHVEATTRAKIDLTNAEGYLALIFALLAVVLALYAATHATAAREEESAGRLDTVLSHAVDRRRWLAGRLVVALVCCALMAAITGAAAWGGARVVGASVGLAGMAEAAANMLPVTVLYLGIGALAVAFVPRHTGAVAFGAVALAYLWQETGALVDAPSWVLGLSPFHWLALAPTEPIDGTSAAVMLGAGVIAAVVAVEGFRRRDLVAA